MIRRRTLLIVCLLACGAPSVGAADEAKSVTLAIDYGDGLEKRFTAIPWKEGLTIADAMEEAAKHPRGIKYSKRGSGENTLLTQIDDLKNGTGDKYWIYSVNGKRGDRSYAIMKLKAGDAVEWSFDVYQ
jgi:hypothetical protein